MTGNLHNGENFVLQGDGDSFVDFAVDGDEWEILFELILTISYLPTPLFILFVS